MNQTLWFLYFHIGFGVWKIENVNIFINKYLFFIHRKGIYDKKVFEFYPFIKIIYFFVYLVFNLMEVFWVLIYLTQWINKLSSDLFYEILQSNNKKKGGLQQVQRFFLGTKWPLVTTLWGFFFKNYHIQTIGCSMSPNYTMNLNFFTFLFKM